MHCYLVCLFFCRGCFNLNDLCCTGKWNNIDYDEIFLFSELFPFFWKKTFFRGKLIFFSKRKISQNPPNWLPMPGAILEVLDWYVFEQKNTLQKNNKNLKNQQIRKKNQKRKMSSESTLVHFPEPQLSFDVQNWYAFLAYQFQLQNFNFRGLEIRWKKSKSLENSHINSKSFGSCRKKYVGRFKLEKQLGNAQKSLIFIFSVCNRDISDILKNMVSMCRVVTSITFFLKITKLTKYGYPVIQTNIFS